MPNRRVAPSRSDLNGADGANGNSITRFEILAVYLNYFDGVQPGTFLIWIDDTWGVTDIIWNDDHRDAQRALVAWDKDDSNDRVPLLRVLCQDAQDEDPDQPEGTLQQVAGTGFQTERFVTTTWVKQKLMSIDALDELQMTPEDGGFSEVRLQASHDASF